MLIEGCLEVYLFRQGLRFGGGIRLRSDNLGSWFLPLPESGKIGPAAAPAAPAADTAATTPTTATTATTTAQPIKISFLCF